MRTVLLDDRLLLDRLLGNESVPLRRLLRGKRVATTGLWYYRLCHAIRSDLVIGALSGPFAAAPVDVRARASAALVRLPDNIELTSLRDLVPTMADLISVHRLNVLSLEALAAARHLEADIALATGSENPALMDAASAEGLRLHTVAIGA